MTETIIKDGLPYCAECGSPKFFNIQGRIVRCSCKCEVQALELAEQKEKEEKRAKQFAFNQARHGLPKRYFSAEFDTSERLPHNESIYEKAEKFCEKANSVLKSNIGFYVFGENSTGKTHLLACMYNDLLRKGFTTLFITIDGCLNEVQNSFKDGQSDGIADLCKKVAVPDFLFIDDLGKEFVGQKSGFAEKILMSLINARYESGKPTFFSSNFDIDELAKRFKIENKVIEQIREMATKRVALTGFNFRKRSHEKRVALLKELGL